MLSFPVTMSCCISPHAPNQQCFLCCETVFYLATPSVSSSEIVLCKFLKVLVKNTCVCEMLYDGTVVKVI